MNIPRNILTSIAIAPNLTLTLPPLSLLILVIRQSPQFSPSRCTIIDTDQRARDIIRALCIENNWRELDFRDIDSLATSHTTHARSWTLSFLT